MKTILLSTATGALLFTGLWTDTGEAERMTENKEVIAIEDSAVAYEMEELSIIQNQVPAGNDSVQVVEDNPYKRVLFIGDETEQKKYKTIFIKKTNRLKIIDLNRGQIFNEII